jgi:hypothetical protein
LAAWNARSGSNHFINNATQSQTTGCSTKIVSDPIGGRSEAPLLSLWIQIIKYWGRFHPVQGAETIFVE